MDFEKSDMFNPPILSRMAERCCRGDKSAMGSRRFPCQLPRIGSRVGRWLGSERESIFRKTKDDALGVSIVCCWLLTNGYSYEI
jgi:hypothetical protein